MFNKRIRSTKDNSIRSILLLISTFETKIIMLNLTIKTYNIILYDYPYSPLYPQFIRSYLHWLTEIGSIKLNTNST